MPWLDNTFVGPDRSLYTVLPNGDLEIRGPGWSGRRRRSDPPDADRPRVCKLGSVKRAKRIAELIAQL